MTAGCGDGHAAVTDSERWERAAPALALWQRKYLWHALDPEAADVVVTVTSKAGGRSSHIYPVAALRAEAT